MAGIENVLPSMKMESDYSYTLNAPALFRNKLILHNKENLEVEILGLFKREPYCSFFNFISLIPEDKPCYELGGGIFIYNKWVSLLLTEVYPVFDNKYQKGTVIDGRGFVENYKNGFLEGIKKWNKVYQLPREMVREFIRSLHDLYHHSEIDGFEGGWKKFLISYPINLEPWRFYQFGFYAGLSHRLFELRKDYPKLFHDFDRCYDKSESRNKKTVNENLKLSDVIKDDDTYNKIMQALTVKHCDPVTHQWIDYDNGKKGLLAAVLNHLHFMQCYKNNKRPKAIQMLIISKNTFGVEMSIDTIHHSRPKDFDLSFLKGIKIPIQEGQIPDL